MAFVNISLLLGTALLAIPIVLHLAMRQQPKRLIFPALRFIRQRQESNRRRLQLRQWLLLLLRCLVLALLALALARPSVPSATLGGWLLAGICGLLLVPVALLGALSAVQRRGTLLTAAFLGAAALLAVAALVAVAAARSRGEGLRIGNQQAPVAAVIAIDTSPRMQLVRENRTRLEQAQEMALWLVDQFPAGSEVAVIEARPGARAFAVDVDAAEQAIERLETCFAPRAVPELLEDGIELVLSSSKTRREVYVFSDLTRVAWSGASAERIRSLQARAADVLLTLVDVGLDDPRNASLGDVKLSADVLPRGSELELQLSAVSQGAGGKQTIELQLERQDPQLPLIRDGQIVLPETQLRGTQIVELPENGSQPLRFRLGGLSRGIQHGTLRLIGGDALALDDVRYFTVDVQDATPVLVLAPPDVVTRYFTEAIAPYEFRETDRARYACAVRPQAELSGLELADYAVVCLLDPLPLTPPDWIRLKSFVGGGGGLAIFLGHNAEPTSFSDPAAIPLLGGRLSRQWRSAGELTLRLEDYSHPLTAAFRDLEGSVPWNRFPVHRHWGLENLESNARTVIRYSNGEPAILETSLGRGRALVMTTPISDPLSLRGRSPWNELPTGEDAWPYFVLVNEIADYLSATAGTRLNFLAGEPAVLLNRPTGAPERYQLFTPRGQPQEVLAADGRIQVKFTEFPGTYRLKGFLGGPISRGFSVNLPAAASDLQRLETGPLDELLGRGGYQLARSVEEITLGVGEARLGREFYPYLVCLVALLLGLEYLLASRFYPPL